MKHYVQEYIDTLKKQFRHVPFINDLWVEESGDLDFIMLMVTAENAVSMIHVICLERAVPQSVKKAIDKIAGQDYWIIMAPYISDASAKLCEEAGVGYCDLSGNCLFMMDKIYISNKGNPNKYPVKDHAKTIFKSSSTTTSLILRELMKDTSKAWKVKDLAEKVNCSIGLVSRVKTYLCEQRWAETGADGFRIVDPEALMLEWSKAYETPEAIGCYTLDNLPVFEEKCFYADMNNHIKNCLTGLSGGVRYEPAVRYTKAHVWVSRRDVDDFLKATDCKRVDSGSNVIIYVTDSDEVFTDCRTIGNSVAASPVQVYLDCMQLKGRGEEMAAAVFEKEIH